MPIPYCPEIPLQSICGIYKIPATMAHCIDQLRLDAMIQVKEGLGLDPALFGLLRPESSEHMDSFNAQFDPLASMGDTSLSGVAPGVEASLPPLPLSLMSEIPQVHPEMTLYTAMLAKRLKHQSDSDVLALAKIVAASFCDEHADLDRADRNAAILYMAVNNGDSPVARFLAANPHHWQARSRTLKLPDMRDLRKQDFITLFEKHGQPLAPHELECVSDEHLLRFVHDMRCYVLERNRHVAFCSGCENRLAYFSRIAMLQPEDNSWIM